MYLFNRLTGALATLHEASRATQEAWQNAMSLLKAQQGHCFFGILHRLKASRYWSTAVEDSASKQAEIDLKIILYRILEVL